MEVQSEKQFIPFPLLRGPHAQTVWASKVRRPSNLFSKWERVEIPDGDFIDIVWTKNTEDPLVAVLHGLEGSYNSSTYIKCLMASLQAKGIQAVLIHFRGCSGEINRLERSYHAGDTQDIQFILDHIAKEKGLKPFAIVGYSLGGNVLLKWLGERNPSYIKIAVAISVPFDLSASADKLNRGLSRFYQKYLIKSMKEKLTQKFKTLGEFLNIKKSQRLDSFRTFDDAVTAPLHGFSNVEEYYRTASCLPYLSDIKNETLIIHSLDDPFLPSDAIPTKGTLSSSTTLELTTHGGHVGFVGTNNFGLLEYWLENRVTAHLEAFL